MIVLAPALALLALWLLGALVLSLAHARHGTLLERLTTDFVAGIVALATLGMTTIALGGRIAVWHTYLLTAVLAVAYLWRRRITPRGGETGPSPGRQPNSRSNATPDHVTHGVLETPSTDLRPPAHAPTLHTSRLATVVHAATARLTPRNLLGASAFIILLLTTSAGQDRLAWDGWAFWTLKARILFHEGTLPLETLVPAGPYPYAHPDYPLAIPLLDWWLFRHAGVPYPVLASLAGVLWFAALAPLVWAALAESAGARIAALATLGTTAFWHLAFYATGGYADIAITLALLGSVLELRRLRAGWAGGPATGAALRLALYLTLAALAKNEGLALALIGAVAAVARGLGAGERRPGYYVVFALPLIALAPWFIFTRTLGLVPQHLEGAELTLGDAVTRIPIILAALGKLLFSRAWVPLPFLVLVAMYAALRRGRFEARTEWWVVGAYAAVIGGVYLGTSLELEWLLRTTIDRMVGHVVPAIVVLSLWEIWPMTASTAGQAYTSATLPDDLAPADHA